MNTDFHALQAAFTTFIRQPDTAPVPPGCDPARMQLYHTLFFNNFDGVLEAAFPRFQASLSAADWRAIVQPFFAAVPQHSPYFADVPLRFADYLAEGSPVPLTAAQQELLAYEAALHECRIGGESVPLSTDECPPDLLHSVLKPHPDSVLLECVYPVHDTAFNPHTTPPSASWLWLLRDKDGVVQTTVLSAASARWLVLLETQDGQPAAASLAQLAAELAQPLPELLPSAQRQLTQWWNAGLLIRTTNE